jgi:hypothetical protein
MLRALNPYIDYVQGLQAQTRDIHIEGKVHLRWTKRVWGTTDCAARIRYKSGLVNLRIVDLKFGMGVPVSPVSAQLMIYALGAIDTFWPKDYFDTVDLVVVQPRLNPKPQMHSMVAEELILWRDEELTPAVRRIENNDQTERVGPYCRWCVRKPECQSFANYKSSLAADIFNDGVDTLNC